MITFYVIRQHIPLIIMVNQSKTTSKRGHVHVRERLQMYMNFGLKT